MVSLVSKKYTKALVDSINSKDISNVIDVLRLFSNCFNDDKFKYIINSPMINKNKKESFLFSLIDTTNQNIINFIKLLNSKNRLNQIPSIYRELQKYVNIQNNEYE